MTTSVFDVDGNVTATRRASYQLLQAAPPVLQAIDEVFRSGMHLHHTPRASVPTVLPGQTVTLAAGQILHVPPDAILTVRQGNGGISTEAVQSRSTVPVPSGTVLTVPAEASGAADSTILVY